MYRIWKDHFIIIPMCFSGFLSCLNVDFRLQVSSVHYGFSLDNFASKALLFLSAITISVCPPIRQILFLMSIMNFRMKLLQEGLIFQLFLRKSLFYNSDVLKCFLALKDRCWVVPILNFNFLPNSLWITMPTQSCLVLYSFCTNLLIIIIIIVIIIIIIIIII